MEAIADRFTLISRACPSISYLLIYTLAPMYSPPVTRIARVIQSEGAASGKMSQVC